MSTAGAWGRSNPLLEIKVFVDGAPAQVQGFQQRLWAPQLCDAGVDPQYCSRNSGYYRRVLGPERSSETTYYVTS